MTSHKVPVKLIIGLNVLAVVAVLVYYNNAKETHVVTPEKPAAASEKTAAQTAHAPQAAVPTAAAAAGLHESVLPVSVCKVKDTVNYFVKVGVKLIYAEPGLKAEIKEKEEKLLTLVQFVFAGKSVAQIEAERCRHEILEKVNRFLTQGKAKDAVFTAFDIVPAPEKQNTEAMSSPEDKETK